MSEEMIEERFFIDHGMIHDYAIEASGLSRLREALQTILDFSDTEMEDGDAARRVAADALNLPRTI